MAVGCLAREWGRILNIEMIKHVIKQLAPPVFVTLLRWVLRANGRVVVLGRQPDWEVVPEGWRDDDARSRGWDHPSISATQAAKWNGFLAMVAGSSPLGVSPESPPGAAPSASVHNTLITFAYVLARTALTVGTGRVSVLDWGGGLGQYYHVARAVLPEIELDYTVKDLPVMCRAARSLSPEVAFVEDESCLARGYDLVFASSVLHYARDWPAELARLAAAARQYLFITRLFTAAGVDTFVVVQRPHRHGYHTEYISWVLGRDEFLAAATAAGLALEREVLVDEAPRVQGAPAPVQVRGFLFRRVEHRRP